MQSKEAKHYMDELTDTTDTAKAAESTGAAEAEAPKPSLLKQLWSFFAPTIICCGVVLIINTFFIFYAVVPTGSMKNLIMEGSYILANRLAYVNSDVQRGDVIVFEHVTADYDAKYLVKRVIAVAGDTVELRDGRVYLNGEELDESAYVLGRTYPKSDRSIFTVPENCVLTFGDNREGSADARSWLDPYVSIDTIKGKVFCTFSIRNWYIRSVK